MRPIRVGRVAQPPEDVRLLNQERHLPGVVSWRVSVMSAAREKAERVAAAILRLLRVEPGQADAEAVALLIDEALSASAQQQEKHDLDRIAEVQASAQAHMAELLNASPAVIYRRAAEGDFQPTFVSDSVTRLFGCTPRDFSPIPISGGTACTRTTSTTSMPGSTACSMTTEAPSSIASGARTAHLCGSTTGSMSCATVTGSPSL